MLQGYALKTIRSAPLRGQLAFLQPPRTYSSDSRKQSEEAELEAARSWFSTFKETTIPSKLAETHYTMAGGSGGQKTNKTSSKANTAWDLDALIPYVPKIIHQELRNSRYYSQNQKETFRRLFDEIRNLYKDRVPGVTAPEQKRKVEEFEDFKKNRASMTRNAQLQMVQSIKRAKKKALIEAAAEKSRAAKAERGALRALKQTGKKPKK